MSRYTYSVYIGHAFTCGELVGTFDTYADTCGVTDTLIDSGTACSVTERDTVKGVSRVIWYLGSGMEYRSGTDWSAK